MGDTVTYHNGYSRSKLLEKTGLVVKVREDTAEYIIGNDINQPYGEVIPYERIKK